MKNSNGRRGIEIAPLRGLRYALEPSSDGGAAQAKALTSPPYDVISPEEHRRFLELSPRNIVRLTLGSKPGDASSYEERGALLHRWVEEGALVVDDDPSFYVYVIEYTVPGAKGGAAPARARFVGFIGLGRLHPFADGVVLPHERTFPKVVDDRLRLLAATRANLESIFVLYSDPARSIDLLLEAQAKSPPVIRVEAKPGEFHALHKLTDVAVFVRLIDFMRTQRPIIADGHHRYTTSLRYSAEAKDAPPGAGWQMMTFANLHGEGLSILATHRLVKLAGAGAESAIDDLVRRFERAGEADCDLTLETRGKKTPVRFPRAVREARKGVGRTSYALVHDVALGEWLKGRAPEEGIRYFKQGTGEDDALARGEGDVLFRMKPVGREELREVVEGGEVFPHKTTYFYPKLWSGLVLWPLAEPDRLALK